ncbi:ABC transporter permease [Jonesiaceae bacterium BS-20]|uniref:ABC transporter permease n=1 Tax=Jonesiaceae bacterium BS-20 TaxID=3120821 RepID=A0AAU7DUN4_9MICO
MTTALEQGLIYAIVALGVYLTFRILDFPDLTVDGSFTLGAAVTAKMIIDGGSPLLATAAGFGAGMIAGIVTGLLHTKGKINGLLAGILTMIALYSVNLRVMGKSNLSLLREETLISPLKDNGLLGTATSIMIFAAIALLIKFIIDWFLHTDLGLAVQATGDNEDMIRSFGVNTDNSKILTLALSNGLVALSGGLVAQYQGYADSGMGIGLILVGLASVILGQAIFGSRHIFVSTLAVILGSVLYRLVIYFALDIGFNPNDMKLITAVIVVIALLLPQWRPVKNRKPQRPGDSISGVSIGSAPTHYTAGQEAR